MGFTCSHILGRKAGEQDRSLTLMSSSDGPRDTTVNKWEGIMISGAEALPLALGGLANSRSMERQAGGETGRRYSPLKGNREAAEERRDVEGM